MGWTSQLVCLGLLAIGAGGVGARVAWVTDAPQKVPHEAPQEGRRVARSIGSTVAGTQMAKLAIESEITFRYARTTINCVLVNNNPVASQIAFKTTLPSVAFVSSFHIDVGGERFEGEVKGKAEAKRIYEAARAAGKTAAEVELTARDANLFTVSVNVEASETVTFSLTYDEMLVRRLGVYTHAVHIDPGQIVNELSVKVKIEESNKLLALAMDSLRPFSSTAHSGYRKIEHEPVPTVIRPTNKSATIEWNPTPEEQRALKKDGIEGRFVVQYDIERLSNPNQILVHDGYFVHFYAPGDLLSMNKHVVFVLDTSGSMGGTRIQQLKEAMGKVLSELRTDDFFSIVEFNSNIKAWTGFDKVSFEMDMNTEIEETLVVKASHEKIQKAKNFVQSLVADGGTNIHDSLIVALRITRAGAEKFALLPKRPEPMIIFLTDGDPNGGAVSDKKLIPSAIEASNTNRTPIYSLGFGQGIDMAFLRELSRKNFGSARHIYEGIDAASQLEDFVRENSSPLLKDLEFLYKNVDNSTVTRVAFNTLHSGTEMIISGKIIGDPANMRATLSAKSLNGRFRTGFAPPEEITVVREDFMERLWAYLSIQQLLENPNNLENKRKAQDIALHYSFVTPLTSLVVVRPDAPAIDARMAGGDSALDDSDLIRPEGSVPGRQGSVESPEGIDHDVRSQNSDGTEQKPLRLSWPSPEFNSTHVIIKKGQRIKAYEVKKRPTEENFAACRGVGGTWHHCRHVNSCILPVFADNFKKYEKSYFCAIPGNFAGVCCPST